MLTVTWRIRERDLLQNVGPKLHMVILRSTLLDCRCLELHLIASPFTWARHGDRGLAELSLCLLRGTFGDDHWSENVREPTLSILPMKKLLQRRPSTGKSRRDANYFPRATCMSNDNTLCNKAGKLILDQMAFQSPVFHCHGFLVG